MKTIIAGSRSLTDIEYVVNAIRISNFNVTEVVSGAARGIDLLGEEWANIHNIPVSSHPANWKLYGIKAGFKRNAEMGDYANALIAIHDGVSKGTLHMIKYMKSIKKPVFVYNPISPNLMDFL